MAVWLPSCAVRASALRTPGGSGTTSAFPPNCPKDPRSAFGAWFGARARTPASNGSKVPAPASPLWALRVFREGARVGAPMPVAQARPAGPQAQPVIRAAPVAEPAAVVRARAVVRAGPVQLN